MFVARLGDGADPAALKDAAQVAFKECALFSADPAKGKAMCYVSVPPPAPASMLRLRRGKGAAENGSRRGEGSRASTRAQAFGTVTSHAGRRVDRAGLDARDVEEERR